MAQEPISQFPALGGAPATNDLLVIVDVSDTSEAATGTTKKLTIANVMTSPAISAPTISAPVVTGGLTVSSGTTAVQALTATTGAFGALSSTALATFTAGLSIGATNAVAAAGQINFNTIDGLQITGRVGSTYDVSIISPTAGYVFRVPTGTANVQLPGAVDITGVTTHSALVSTVASATGSAGLRLPHGVAPTSPVNGDFWTTTAGAFIRINGVTKTFTLT